MQNRMDSITYSKEQIEAKRLSALAKKNKNTNNGETKPVQVPQINGFIKNNSLGNATNLRANSSWTPSFQTKNNVEAKPVQVPQINKVNGFFKNNSINPQPSSSRAPSSFQANKSGVYKQKQAQNRYDPMNSTKFYNNNSSERITGNCIMIQNNRFAIELKKYHAPIVDVFKTMSSKAYDSQRRLWHFHLKDYDQLLEKLIRRSDCTITGLPKFTKQTFDKLLKANEETKIDLSRIDETLRESLMPFQQEGIRFGILKKGRCMIADDMGLGKTIQALGIANYFKDNWPLLIVTPSSVRYQWSEAIYKFLPSVPVQNVQHFSKNEVGFEFSKITITSYDLLSRCMDTFRQQFFGVVIFDESHFLKNFKTGRYKAAKEMAKQARHIILLSGTPALSRPLELYSQIALIAPNFMSYADFGIRYCAGIKQQQHWNFTGSSNLQELDLLLKAFCLIRRIKSDVLQQLPSKLRQVVVLDPHLIKAGTKQMEEMAERLQKKTLSGNEKHRALLQYYSESSIAKQKAICDYVGDFLEKREKFLIYAHHQGVLDAICEVIQSQKIQYIRIDGRTTGEQRKELVDKFQDDSDVLVGVLSIQAANAGITLTAAKLVVFAELSWNPGILLQAEDRVHRIGQDKGVVIQYLIGKNTVDDYLWPKLQHKLDVLNKAGLDQEFTIKDNDVSIQIAVENDQKRIDEFTNGNSSFNSEIPNTKPYKLNSPAPSSSKNQTKMDSFLSRSTDSSKTSTNNNSFASLLDDEDFDDIDLNEFV